MVPRIAGSCAATLSLAWLITACGQHPGVEPGPVARCGDGLCQATDESATLCPEDCAVSDLALMRDGSCALRVDGTVWCWGRLPIDGPAFSNCLAPSPPAPVSGLTDVVQIAAADAHACAVTRAGEVLCWGANDVGQLGRGTTSQREPPGPVVGLTDAVQVSVGFIHSCALRSDGGVWCWGCNESTQLGLPADLPPASAVPVPVEGLGDVAQLVAGFSDTCVRRTDGTVACFGARVLPVWAGSNFGDCHSVWPQECHWEFHESAAPVPVEDASNVLDVRRGHSFGCVTLPGAEVRCWGANRSGELGDGTDVSSPIPVPVALPAPVRSVRVGRKVGCALLEPGDPWCWGSSASGLLGADDDSVPTPPEAVPSPSALDVPFAVGEDHACATGPEGQVRCWGQNNCGQLGDLSLQSSPVPVPVLGL